jgi:hypothetical protein
MTDAQVLAWIKTNLRPYILQALWNAKRKNPQLLYTSEWLAAQTYREVGFLIARYMQKGYTPEQIHPLMKGDYNQRPQDKEARYHGYHYMQIDIGSYPKFIESGDWKDPFKGYEKAIEVLEEKRIDLQRWFPDLKGDDLCRAVCAAYNCGQGGAKRAIVNKEDIDAHTYEKNYSKEVWRFRSIYKTLS